MITENGFSKDPTIVPEGIAVTFGRQMIDEQGANLTEGDVNACKNLGKRLKVGETFIATTKRMTKDRTSNTKWNENKTGKLVTYEVLRPGAKRFFTKGKRPYFCEVLYMDEFRTGLYVPGPGGPRWYQFSYMVKILEN